MLECVALIIHNFNTKLFGGLFFFLSFHPKDFKLAYSVIMLKHEDRKATLFES